MPWILEAYNAGVFAATYNVIDNSKAIVACDLLKLNDSKVICPATTPINVDQEVKVVDNVVDPVTKQVTERHILLHGYVQKYGQITKGENNNTFEYTIKELAVELEKYRVHTVDNSYTVNCDAQNTSQYVGTICYGTPWTYATGVVNQALQGIQFRYMTGIAALNKIVTSLTAASASTPLYMWFDSSDRKVGWGEYRNDLTAATNFVTGVYYNYKEEKTVRNQVAGVVIFGANSSYSGYYPDPLPTDQHDLAVYEYDDATTNAECAEIAKAVYLTWCADPKRRIQFFLRPADTKIGGQYMVEGDRIKVDGENYTIIDMTYSPKDILVGVNAGEDSALYSLGDKLRPVAGTSSGLSEIVWAPGTESVANDYTKTLFPLEISDKANIQGNVMMNVTIGPYKVFSFPAATAIGNDYLDNVTAPAIANIDTGSIQLSCGDTIYLPNTSWPNPWLASETIENGFAFAIATISMQIRNDDANNPAGNLYVKGLFSYDSISWFEGSHQAKISLFPCAWSVVTGSTLAPVDNYVTLTFIVPGHTAPCQLYSRFWLWNDTSSAPGGLGVMIANIWCHMDIIPRHSHVVKQSGQTNGTIVPNQTDNMRTTDVPPPALVYCSVNSGTPFSVSNNTPVDITSKLISGRNTIEFSSGTICTVTPSSTYKMFGG